MGGGTIIVHFVHPHGLLLRMPVVVFVIIDVMMVMSSEEGIYNLFVCLLIGTLTSNMSYSIRLSRMAKNLIQEFFPVLYWLNVIWKLAT